MQDRAPSVKSTIIDGKFFIANLKRSSAKEYLWEISIYMYHFIFGLACFTNPEQSVIYIYEKVHRRKHDPPISDFTNRLKVSAGHIATMRGSKAEIEVNCFAIKAYQGFLREQPVTM